MLHEKYVIYRVRKYNTMYLLKDQLSFLSNSMFNILIEVQNSSPSTGDHETELTSAPTGRSDAHMGEVPLVQIGTI